MKGPKSLLAIGMLGVLAACDTETPVGVETEPLEARIAGATHGGRPFQVELTGAAEAPDAGDPDGTGSAFLTLNAGQGEVCWDIAVSDIALPGTGAHIHEAPAGSPGPVVVPLVAPDGSGTSTGCTSAATALIEDILDDPAGYYVNVHNEDFPGGALRGQLR